MPLFRTQQEISICTTISPVKQPHLTVGVAPDHLIINLSMMNVFISVFNQILKKIVIQNLKAL